MNVALVFLLCCYCPTTVEPVASLVFDLYGEIPRYVPGSIWYASLLESTKTPVIRSDGVRSGLLLCSFNRAASEAGGRSFGMRSANRFNVVIAYQCNNSSVIHTAWKEKSIRTYSRCVMLV